MKITIIILSFFQLLESCFLGGGGCGCGCLPRLPPPEFTCVSVPVLKLSLPTCTTPCCPHGPSFSPCGKRKKRKVNLMVNDYDCTDNLLRQMILKNIKNDTILSVHLISTALKEFYGYNNTFGVSCGSRKDFFYSTTMINYCFEGMSKVQNFDERPENICLFYVEVKSCYDQNQDFDMSFECQQGPALKISLNFTGENKCYALAFPEKYLSWKNRYFSLNRKEKVIVFEVHNFRGSFTCKINKLTIFKIFVSSFQNIRAVKVIGNVKINVALLVNKDITHL